MYKDKYDLCFHTGQDIKAVNWFIDLKGKLESRGISAIAYSLNPLLGLEWEKKGMHDYYILEQHKGEINVPDAASYAKQLGISNFRSLYQTEQLFYDLDENYCQNKIARYITTIRESKNLPNAKFYMTFAGDEFDHNCLRLISRAMKGRTIYSTVANIEGRFVIFENEERYWKVPKKTLSQPSENDINNLRDYIKNYIEKQTIFFPVDRDPKFLSKYLFKIISRFNKSKELRKTRPQFTNLKIISNFLSLKYNKFKSKKYYSDYYKLKDSLNNLVYLPLHYPRDSQLTLRGKPFLNQFNLVNVLSTYLPYPYVLIVKEHPNARGYFSAREIKAISKLPNVKIIHPNTNSHTIIPKAKAIVVINSSVGFESILHKKPVISFGRSFYRGQGLTIDVDSLYDIETAFEKMENFEIYESDILNFLWRIKQYSYPISSYFDKSNANTEDIATAITDYMNKLS
jgi:hypothetical protein